MDNASYLLALHSVNGLGPVRLKAVLNYFKDPKLAWNAQSKILQEIGIPKNVIESLEQSRKTLDPQSLLEKLEKSGIKWISFFDNKYPKLLKQIYDPPFILYYKGEILPRDQRAIGVVGTRKITGYGQMVTNSFTKAMVAAGLTVVSGLARGVDTYAHKTAVESGGRTIAVLGGGLNKIFPFENTNLAEEIANGHGAVISEFPPEYESLPGNFPARNRIISGLSLGVLVTEAAIDSGSLITARLALEQGREVFAVPGPVTSDLSRGPADLIKEGARLVFEPNDVLEELGLQGIQNLESRTKNLENLSKEEMAILDFLENENKHIDEVCRGLGISAPIVSGTLLKLEIQGVVRNLGGGVYCKC
jgi:DNA processing protein